MTDDGVTMVLQSCPRLRFLSVAQCDKVTTASVAYLQNVTPINAIKIFTEFSIKIAFNNQYSWNSLGLLYFLLNDTPKAIQFVSVPRLFNAVFK